MATIWDTLPKPFFCLAPMEGVTDVIFRQVIAQASRPDLFFTEFTNVSSYANERGKDNALERLEIAPTDSPIIAQIWGKNPEHFSELASALKELGFSGIDLNFGCPDKNVNRAGGGAAMIKTPELAIECFKNARNNSNHLPVSIKTRLGFSFIEEYKTWLPTLLKEEPDALTVHLRTRKEMSKVAAHYELIPDIVNMRNTISPKTKLIINGDIKTRKDGLILYEKNPEIDGFMIGRGVFQNPFCFKKTKNEKPYQPSHEELISLLFLHLKLFDKKNQNRIAHNQKPLNYEPLKHFYKIYINNFPGASELRSKLMETKNTLDAQKLLS